MAQSVAPGTTGDSRTAEDVLVQVNSMVHSLRARAPQTERLRRMHPDSLRDLEEAGVFRLAMPVDVGGHRADEAIIAEVLAQIGRGCPSTAWMCTIILCSNTLPAVLSDEAATEIYATRDLRVTAAIAPTARATLVDGHYRVTGRWAWNTAGLHGNWFAGGCMVTGEEDAGLRVLLIPTRDLQHRDTWYAMGLAGSATNAVVAEDVRVPAARSILVSDLAEGRYPPRRYSADPYYNRPWLMFMNSTSAPAILGAARGAMDSFRRALDARGAITSTSWSRAAEAPVLHHQLAAAQYDLETAEMYLNRLTTAYRDVAHRQATLMERVQARAYIGHIASLSRSCVARLFDASSSSEALLSADIQRYLRDLLVLHQHANIQPSTGDESYGRVLAGLPPHTAVL